MAEHMKEVAIGFIGGITGAIASVYVGQPLDTVKVKLQTFPDLYKNAWSCFRDTYRKDGIRRGLYAGTIPALTANVAENATLFAALEPTKKLVAYLFGKDNVSQLTSLQCGLSGSLAAFWPSLTLCPTELVKCRLQAMREKIELGVIKGVDMKHVGPFRICRDVIHEEGFRGFFRGLLPTFGREMPGYFFFFGGYEASRNFFLNHLQSSPVKSQVQSHSHGGGGHVGGGPLGPLQTAICGGIGGVSFWVAIFPLDVLKSRMQIAEAGQRVRMITLCKTIVKQEGFKSLYKGLGPTVVRTFPATGALFVAYENTRRFLS